MRGLIGYIVVATAGVLAGIPIGWIFAANHAWKGPLIAEFKVHHHNLQNSTLEPQLQEYLKSRVYFLSNLLEPRDLSGFKLNFGPVDQNILAGNSGIKCPETETESYESAMRKHDQK